MSPDKNSGKQVDLLQKKDKLWIDPIGTSHLSPYHKRLSFQMGLRTQLTYPLGVVPLRPKEYYKIFKTLLRVVKSLFTLMI